MDYDLLDPSPETQCPTCGCGHMTMLVDADSTGATYQCGSCGEEWGTCGPDALPLSARG